jgi:hypothetical protein
VVLSKGRLHGFANHENASRKQTQNKDQNTCREADNIERHHENFIYKLSIPPPLTIPQSKTTYTVMFVTRITIPNAKQEESNAKATSR